MVTARKYPLIKNEFLAWLSPWSLGTLLLVSIFMTPVIAIAITAGGDSDGLWVHLANTVLPRYVANTLT